MPVPEVFRSLTPDGVLLFATRATRMFAYGFLSVVLVLYLKSLGLSDEQVGLLLTMTLLGDANWWLPRWLDRILPRVELDGADVAREVEPSVLA